MADFGPFAQSIAEHKYLWTKEDGTKETWAELAERVSTNVLKSVGASQSLIDDTTKAIAERKFVPGGRYLRCAGKQYHQTQNCALFRAEDSREGWAETMHKITLALMTGAGVGVVYSDLRGSGKAVRKTGGTSSGPLALMQMVNEAGRGIVNGGDRRAAIWAGLHWNHPDVHAFITLKNWSADVRALKEKDYNFPAPMDMTNISVILDDAFFAAYDNDQHPQHSLAHGVYRAVVRQMLKTAEPGFSIDVGVNQGENLRNACVPGYTQILTDDGYKRIDSLVGQKVNAWNGFEWSEVQPRVTGQDQRMLRVKLSSGQELVTTFNHHFWLATDYVGGRERVEARLLKTGDKLIKHDLPVIEHGCEYQHMYSQGFISGDGMDGYPFASVYEPKYPCLSRLEGEAQKEYGGRVQFYWSFEPHFKSFVPLDGNLKSRVEWLAGFLDSDGTELREGGAQIGSVDRDFLLSVQKMLTTMGVASKVTLARKAGDRKLPDGNGGSKDYFCQDLYRILIGAVQMQHLKRLGLKCERMAFDKQPQRDASQFVTVTEVEFAGVENTVYCFTEPKRNLGCFEGVVTGQCTEVTSRDDSDICNLGSINLARVKSLEEMRHLVEIGTAFLLAGTVYSDVPFARIDQVRTKNRRLGLGLMGVAEWFAKRAKTYGPDNELGAYMSIYELDSDFAAMHYAALWELSRPVKVRAIAPTGTIGIVAETTTGIEPIFCVAYKRRYLKGTTWNYQYVVEPVAKRLIDSGVPAEQIEDAYTLADDVERRVAFQAWMQQYVDHGISSTINLPAWGSEQNNDSKVIAFGDMLYRYLPKLRGVTCYPDGARGGQPLTPVKYSTAMKHIGEVFIEAADICDISKGGSCGA